MAKVYVDCADPNDLASLEAAFEQLQGKCDITYFRQAKGLMETGLVDSRRAAERHIAQETGETPSAVHARVQRGQKKLVHGEPPSPTPLLSNEIQENQEPEPRKHVATGEKPPGGRREGSGRPAKYEQDTDALFQLKRWWKLASKRDQKTFINWIGTEES